MHSIRIEHVADFFDANSVTQFNENYEDWEKIIDQLLSQSPNFEIFGTNNSFNNIEQHNEKSIDFSTHPLLAPELIKAQLECTIVFKGPDGNFYIAPYAFVRENDTGLEIKNSAIFDMAKDAINENDLFFLKMVICKLKNIMFECDSREKNKICQIKRFPCGTIVKVDHEQLSSWGINQQRNSMNRNAKHVTPTKLAKHLKIYTAYLVFRRINWDPDEKQYVPEQEILFCSNAFTPLDGSHRPDQYDYSPNEIQIKQSTLLPASSRQNTNEYDLQVSYSIQEMYKCTGLKNKYFIIKILTGNEKKSNIHPNYKLMDGQGPVDSLFIPVNEYNSTLMLKITKCTVEEWKTDSTLNPTVPVSSANIATVPMATVYNTSMNSLRVQLQLCDYSNNVRVPYPKSIAVSNQLIDGKYCCLNYKTLSSPENDHSTDDSSTDEFLDESLTNVKRSYVKKAGERTGSPLQKIQKH
ncbi:unnamed protein product [Rotaria sp. Silwood1]|nr:unnamed protein product [Rotaria sp. Silwood1]